MMENHSLGPLGRELRTDQDADLLQRASRIFTTAWARYTTLPKRTSFEQVAMIVYLLQETAPYRTKELWGNTGWCPVDFDDLLGHRYFFSVRDFDIGIFSALFYFDVFHPIAIEGLTSKFEESIARFIFNITPILRGENTLKDYPPISQLSIEGRKTISAIRMRFHYNHDQIPLTHSTFDKNGVQLTHSAALFRLYLLSASQKRIPFSSELGNSE